jgi:hypothetical protein
MNEKSTTQQLQFERLLKHGYRPDQLIPRSNGEGFRCSPDDLPAAIALVQNPHGLALADETKSRIQRAILKGYMPHHFFIGSGGDLVYDTEAIENDVFAVAFAERSGRT